MLYFKIKKTLRMPKKVYIQSRENKIIKKVKYLKTKKGRDEHNQFVVEGEKFVDEIPSDYAIEFFVVSQTFMYKSEISNYEGIADIFVVRDNLFKEITQTISPQGIIAAVSKKEYKLSNISIDNCFILVAENLQDPGNLGTLIRTADSAGADAVIITKNSVEAYNPKVIRSAAGSIFNLPIIENIKTNEILEFLKTNGIQIYAAHLKGKKYLYEADFTKNLAIIIGNEGKGLSDDFNNNFSQLIKIPIIGRAESLNASIASAILLYEVVRQRLINF